MITLLIQFAAVLLTITDLGLVFWRKNPTNNTAGRYFAFQLIATFAYIVASLIRLPDQDRQAMLIEASVLVLLCTALGLIWSESAAQEHDMLYGSGRDDPHYPL